MDVPLFPSFNVEKPVDHLLDLPLLLDWVLPNLSEELSHALWTALDLAWNSIDDAKLRRDQTVFASGADQEHWLISIRDFLLVILGEVLSDGHLLTIPLEILVSRSWLKLDIINDISSLVGVVGNHTRSDEFIAASLLENRAKVWNALVFKIIIDLIHSILDRFRGHEATAVVDDERAAIRILVG